MGALPTARTFTSSSTTVPSASVAQRCVLYRVTGSTRPRRPRRREDSSTARRNEPSCCVSAARKRLPNAMPFRSSLFSVSKRCEKSRTRIGSPSASTVSALRISPGAGTSSAMRTFPVDRPESVTAMRPVMSSVCARRPAMMVGAPRPPPTHTVFGPLIRIDSGGMPRYARGCMELAVAGGLRLLHVAPRRGALAWRGRALRPDGLPAAAGSLLRRGRAEAARAARDFVVLTDLDAVSFRGRDDLPAGRLFGGPRLELGLVPPRHRVAHVRLVVEGEVALAPAIDVGERALVELLAFLGI